MSKRIATKVLIALITLFCLFFTPITDSASECKRFRANKDRPTRVSFKQMEIEIPAGAAEEELSVEWGDLDLNGIKIPYGFKPIGKQIRFGPHGKKFSKDKALKIRLQINRKELPESLPSKNIKLFYINRDKQKLETVTHRYDPEKSLLEAELSHFSDYILGITPGWDGNGFNPFMDIATNGEESVRLYGLTVTARSKVLELPGRGLTTDLTRAYLAYPNEDIECLAISPGWYWDLPYIHFNNMLDNPSLLSINIPGKGCLVAYSADQEGIYWDFPSLDFRIYRNNNVSYAVKRDYNKLPVVYLNDGTKIERPGYYPYNTILVTDRNNNWFKYTITQIRDKNENYHPRITSLTDSLGRVFTFEYDNRYYFLTKVKQVLATGHTKTILTRSNYGNTESFTDALGRTTTYSYLYPYYYADNTISKVLYPNGAVSEYSYTNKFPITQRYLSQQRLYAPNQSAKVINYSTNDIYNFSEVTVNDGTKIKKYDFLINYTHPGPILNEYTYTSSGLLKSRLTNSYRKGIFGIYLQSSTICLANSSGVLGKPATCQYAYDYWGNITRILNPNGVETRMAYANTNSEKNLSVYNSLYQNNRYEPYLPINLNPLITKATLINDPVHGTTQLKQTHYQYDNRGNLIQESEVYGDSYLNTTYTYDSYGNVLTKTDANGNTLGYEYSPAFKNAYLTRVYKPDTGQTIATFDYDFDTGKRIMATDPKGNVYRYEYDAIGRLTKEWLDNSDPNIGVTRKLTYDDVNNQVLIEFGNDSAGWQKGLIKYHPLFGKPTEIQRCSNGNWITLKQNIYDSCGRLVSELDGEGHTITHAYDELDRKIRTQLPDGAVTTWTWDDRTCTITDANGNQKVQTYDLLDRLTEVQESPESGITYTTSYIYDNYDDPDTQKTDSHLLKVINPKGVATTYTYDNLGRLIRVDYPQGGANPMAPEVYTYDNVGNLKTKTTAKGTKMLEYEYFAGYRLKKVTEADGRVVSYTYDANDNPITQSAPGATYSYTYDARNRMTNMTATLDGMDFNFGYDYDVFGRMTGISYPNRVSPVNYIYDELDRLQEIPGFVNSCAYDLDQKLTEMVYANGIASNYTYDINDRLTKISVGDGSLLNLDYSYDPVGNISRINDDYYAYDGLNRLIWYGDKPFSQLATASGTRWIYDGAGNMTEKETYLNGVSQNLTSFSYDSANRLWSMGDTVYSNDNTGARTEKVDADFWTYLYDGESRLIQVKKNGVIILTNGYDGSGMRIKKESRTKTTYYLYQGNNPIMEYTPGDQKYTYFIYAGTKLVAEEKDGVLRYYYKDHLGSTRVVTDMSDNVIATYKYKPYGEVESHTGVDIKYGFTGKEGD